MSRRWSQFFLALFAPGLALLLALACGHPERPAAGGAKAASQAYPYDAAKAQAFRLGPAGLVPENCAVNGVAAGAAAAQPAALAPRVAALAVAGPGRAAMALNRYGYALLEASPDASSYRLVSRPLAAASSLSVADLWPRASSYLLELYRDPFASDGQPASRSFGQELFSIDARSAEAKPLPRIGSGEEELFALLPARGAWFAELRSETGEGARLRYLSLSAPDSRNANDAMREIGRADFEAALAPRPISAAPEALRAAVAALAPGPLLLRARGGAELEAYWLSGGRLEEAREASAWVASDGSAALVLERTGEAALAEGGQATRLSFAAPVAGAALTAVALLPLGPAGKATGAASASRSYLALAAWEKGSFPSVEASGLLVLPLGAGERVSAR